jgi:hypothetical protein
LVTSDGSIRCFHFPILKKIVQACALNLIFLMHKRKKFLIISFNRFSSLIPSLHSKKNFPKV